MAFNLLKELKNLGLVQVSAVVLNDGILYRNLLQSGVGASLVDEAKYPFLRLGERIRRILRNFKPDVVHAHRYKENLLAWLATRGSPETRLLTTQHGLPELLGEKAHLRSRIVAAANFLVVRKFFNVAVAVSSDIARRFTEVYGFPSARVRQIYNGINPAPPDTLIFCKTPGRFCIGSAGRLFKVKDFPLMIETAALATREERRVVFLLAGEGPERSSLEAQVARLGLNEGFIFRGHVSSMETFYRGLDVYINTSLHEGIPMSILEAMGLGIPVVAPTVGGISEIITDGVEGFLISQRDPRLFAQSCLTLFKDAGLRMRMSMAARKRIVENFSANTMAHKYSNLYNELVSN